MVILHPRLFLNQNNMDILFYNYNADARVINKSLGTGTTITGYLRNGNVGVLHPSVTIRADVLPHYNYAYIPDFKRYYFVRNITVVDNTTYEINLDVDVLKTYENEIMSAHGNVTRADDANKFTSNRNSVYDIRPNYSKIDFPNTDLFTETGTIIMITIKGTGGN